MSQAPALLLSKDYGQEEIGGPISVPPRRIRIRHRPALNSFHAGVAVRPECASIDRMVLFVDGIVRSTDGTAFSRTQILDRWLDGHSLNGDLMPAGIEWRTGGGPGGGWLRLSRETVEGYRPRFAAKLRLGEPSVIVQNQAPLSIEMQVNPTEIRAILGPDNPSNWIAAQFGDGEELVNRPVNRRNMIDEATLLREGPADKTLQDARSVADATVAVISLALFGRQDAPASVSPEWVGRLGLTRIRQCEVYWEFYTEDATSVVRGLTSVLRGVTKTGLARYWDDGSNNGTISLNARLTDDIVMSIYPKDVNRIRVEIRYLRKVVTSLPKALYPDFRSQIVGLAMDAAPRVDRALAVLVPTVGETQTLADLAGNLSGILCEKVKNPGRVRHITTVLLRDGGITAGSGGHITLAEARSLVRAGVISTARLRRREVAGPHLYSLAQVYRPLLARLTE